MWHRKGTSQRARGTRKALWTLSSPQDAETVQGGRFQPAVSVCAQLERAAHSNTATTQNEGSARLPAQTRTRRSAPHLPAPGDPITQRGRPGPGPCWRYRPGAGARRPPRPCPPPSCQRSPPGAARGRPSAAPCPRRGPLVLSRRSRRRRCGRPRGVSGEELSEPGRAGPGRGWPGGVGRAEGPRPAALPRPPPPLTSGWVPRRPCRCFRSPAGSDHARGGCPPSWMGGTRRPRRCGRRRGGTEGGGGRGARRGAPVAATRLLLPAGRHGSSVPRSPRQEKGSARLRGCPRHSPPIAWARPAVLRGSDQRPAAAPHGGICLRALPHQELPKAALAVLGC